MCCVLKKLGHLKLYYKRLNELDIPTQIVLQYKYGLVFVINDLPSVLILVLYENIDQILPNKIQEPMHYMRYMCIQWTRILYSVVIT